jgi:hypothetical protein
MTHRPAFTTLLGLLMLTVLLAPIGCTEGDDDDSSVSADDDDDADAPLDLDLDSNCEDLNPHFCMMPWPSSRFLVPDAETETGWLVDYDGHAFPENIDEQGLNPARYNTQDGFPASAQILTVFDAPVSDANLPSYLDYGASLDADSPTVVLDMSTGERVAHFSEFDAGFDDPAEILMYIRPAQRLEENRRYAVAIRGLEYDEGGPVLAHDNFRAFRDQIATDDDRIEDRRAALEEVLTALTDAGVERDDLIVAWDFHTQSGASTWREMVYMRDDALARVGDQGLGCTITSVEDDYDSNFERMVRGTVTVPRYVNSPYPPATMVYDDDGLPEFQANMEVKFLLGIPRSLATPEAAPGRLVTYGHSVFYGPQEIEGWSNHWPHDLADDLGLVLVATQWAGMSEDDLVATAQVLANISKAPLIADRLMQGMINNIVLTRTIAGVCADEEAFQIEGHAAFDPDELYFLGISQGGILGGTLLPLSPDIDRGILHVGAANLSVIQSRSVNFEQLDTVYAGWYPDRIDREFYWSVLGHMMDRADSYTYLAHLDDPAVGGPDKRVLLQVGRNDSNVCNVAADMAARTARLPLLTPSAAEVYGLEEAPATPYDGSALLYWEFSVPEVPPDNTPPANNIVHGAVSGTASAAAQLDAFFQPDGVVIHPCDGPCDPE